MSASDSSDGNKAHLKTLGNGGGIANTKHESETAPAHYCSKCATQMEWQVPEGDERHRHVCPNCGYIEYENPRVVVGCVAVSPDNERVLLARRAIPPVGKWTIPSGFLELDETVHAGAAREAWEETQAKVQLSPINLMAVYNILPAKQVQILFRGIVENEQTVKPGIESLEVAFFRWDALPPADDLAFPTVEWALQFAREHRHEDVVQPQYKTR